MCGCRRSCLGRFPRSSDAIPRGACWGGNQAPCGNTLIDAWTLPTAEFGGKAPRLAWNEPSGHEAVLGICDALSEQVAALINHLITGKQGAGTCEGVTRGSSCSHDSALTAPRIGREPRIDLKPCENRLGRRSLLDFGTVRPRVQIPGPRPRLLTPTASKKRPANAASARPRLVVLHRSVGGLFDDAAR